MGRRGPKPTPTPILKIRGSWRAGTRAGEPELTQEDVPCPDWVKGPSRKHWAEVSALMHGLGVMAKPHTLALSLLVDALGDWMKFSAKAARAKPLVMGSTGNEIANPIFALKSRAWERVLKACREFGMTPTALSGVKSIKSDEGKTKPLSRFKIA